MLKEAEHELLRRDEPLGSAEAIHSALLRFGDLDTSDILARTDEVGKQWLDALEGSRRIVPLPVGKNAKGAYVAAEEAGLYRDAIGLLPPRGLPAAYLEPRKNALTEVISRHVRYRAPFVAQVLAKRYGVSEERMRTILMELSRKGDLVHGYFSSVGDEREFVGRDVLRLLRNRALAKARNASAPVSPVAYSAFLQGWQKVNEEGRGREGLRRALEMLEGLPLPLSSLEDEMLPARVEDFSPMMLDLLVASGEVTWSGVEANGRHDARIAFYLDQHEPHLVEPREAAKGEIASNVRALLERKGALFFRDIADTLGGFRKDVLDAIWDLVFAGEVSNDSLVPLRSAFQKRRRDESPLPRAPWGSEGRWFLKPRSEGVVSPIALARLLLARYGVLLPEAVARELGSFGKLYLALKELELAGHVRRGYFVEGAGALQFALPGADDLLRRPISDELGTVVLDATDPANAFGSGVPWPERPDARSKPMRQAGSLVFFFRGTLLAWLSRSRDALITFTDATQPEEFRALADALAAWAKKRGLLLESIDGRPSADAPLAALLQRVGFVGTHGGLILRPEGKTRGAAHARR